MNEQALNDAYQLFTGAGYTGSKDNFLTLINSNVYFSFLLGLLLLEIHTLLFFSKSPIIEPEFGQCAVIIWFFTLTSTKNLLYLLINFPVINGSENFINKLYY